MNDQPTKTRKKGRAKRWLIRLLIVVLLIVCAKFFAEYYAAQTITQQLRDAGFDSAKIKNLSIGFDGVSLTDVAADSESMSLAIGQITANQPLSQLLLGDLNFQSLQLDGVDFKFDTDVETGPSPEFSLVGLKLPAQKISVTNVSVALSDQDSTLNLSGITLSATTESGSDIRLTGNCGDFVGGQLDFDGLLQQNGQLDFDFEADSFEPTDGDWQKWPGIPPSVERHLGVSGVFDLVGSFSLSPQSKSDYSAVVTTAGAHLHINKFNLPIDIRSADILIENGLVTYRAVEAGFEDSDIVLGTGTTTIDGLPCVSKFEGTFKNIDVVWLRRLVPAIPDSVFGNATGKTIGSVVVDEQIDTTLRLSANGDTFNGGYGKIHAKSGNVDVQIQPLKLTSLGVTKNIQGAVTVNADTSNQDADDILATFDLSALDQQFGFDVTGSGKAFLKIPLDSAGQMETWTLDVNAKTDAGKVSDIPIANSTIHSFLKDGSLHFDPVVAQIKSNRNTPETINLKIDWPLGEKLKQKNATGIIKVTGNAVAPATAAAFLAKQLNNSHAEFRFQKGIEQIAQANQPGSLDFQANIKLPAVGDRPTRSWDVDGEILKGSFSQQNVNIGKLKAKIEIADSVLKFSDVSARINSFGYGKGRFAFDLDSREVTDASITAEKIPANWLLSSVLGSEALSKIDGDLSINATPSKSEKDSFRIQVTSNQLALGDQIIGSMIAEGRLGKESFLRSIRARGDNDFSVDVTGRWPIAGPGGKLSAQWSNLPLTLLTTFSPIPADLGKGSSQGKVAIVAGEDGVTVAGDSAISGLVIGSTRLRPIDFEISTNGNQIEVAGKKKLSGMSASISTAAPYEFKTSFKTRKLELATVVDDPRFEQAKVRVNFSATGQASPFSFRTSGTGAFVDRSILADRIAPIRAQWKFDNQQPNKMGLQLKGFGGTATLKPRAKGQGIAELNFNSIDSRQIALLLGTSIPMEGTFNGTLKIADLQKALPRLALSATSSKLKFGSLDIADPVIKASLLPAIPRSGQHKFAYQLEGRLFDGKLTCQGQLADFKPATAMKNRFPVNIQLINASLQRVGLDLAPGSQQFFRRLGGKLSLFTKWQLSPTSSPEMAGRLRLDETKFDGKRVSRTISSDVLIKNQLLSLNKLSAELQQGEISGRANFPLGSTTSGNFELLIRRFSLSRMLQILGGDSIPAQGLISARVSGRTGASIAGRGVLEISRAGLFGVSDQSMKVPIRFALQPRQRTGEIVMPRNRFRLFGGNVNGSASMKFGAQTRLETNLQFANLNSDSMVRSLSGYSVQGTGRLGGTLKLSSRDMKSPKDLTGSFRGSLENSDAFEIPLLNQASRLINTPTLQTRRFNSEEIEMSLSKGVIDVKSFNLRNSLANVTIDGKVTLEGRLQLGLAARVERLNQPTLIDELAGSPLARFQGTPAAFFAQAAEFLSERILFLKIDGSTTNPRFRLDPGKQLREELIRQFLRGSQILPNAINPNE